MFPSFLRVPLLAIALLVAACSERTPPGNPPSISLQAALGGSPEGFERVLGPRPFRFPEDHAAHPRFRTEWWYTTGNLKGPGGEPYGFHFTIFRSALRADPPERTSPVATDQIWMAHFALTDGRSGEMRAFERFARGAAGLGGSSAEPLAIWVDGWRMDGLSGTGEERQPTFTVRAQEAGFGIDLVLEAQKPLVLQGEDGFSQKGAELGSASHYYALTRLAATGSVSWQGERRQVVGTAWWDREWSTSLLEPHQVGWDWFALQLNDGSDLMVYQMRTLEAGVAGVDPTSHGALVRADGSRIPLSVEEFSIEPTGHWTSPRSSARYPSGWRITVAPRDQSDPFNLELEPLAVDQELHLAVRYWEGAVTVRGRRGESPIEGVGYAELTGYD